MVKSDSSELVDPIPVRSTRDVPSAGDPRSDRGSVLALVPAAFLVLVILGALAVDSAADLSGPTAAPGLFRCRGQRRGRRRVVGLDGSTPTGPSPWTRTRPLRWSARASWPRPTVIFTTVRLWIAVAGPTIRLEGTASVDAVFGRAIPGFGVRKVRASVTAIAATGNSGPRRRAAATTCGRTRTPFVRLADGEEDGAARPDSSRRSDRGARSPVRPGTPDPVRVGAALPRGCEAHVGSGRSRLVDGRAVVQVLAAAGQLLQRGSSTLVRAGIRRHRAPRVGRARSNPVSGGLVATASDATAASAGHVALDRPASSISLVNTGPALLVQWARRSSRPGLGSAPPLGATKCQSGSRRRWRPGLDQGAAPTALGRVTSCESRREPEPAEKGTVVGGRGGGGGGVPLAEPTRLGGRCRPVNGRRRSAPTARIDRQGCGPGPVRPPGSTGPPLGGGAGQMLIVSWSVGGSAGQGSSG